MAFRDNNNKSDKNVNILYIFNEGRTKRINSNKIFPEDFFYFFNLLKENYQNTDFIEMNSSRKNLASKLINFLEKVIRKTTGLPFYSSQIISIKNLKKIFKSKLLVLTNETVGFSSLFVLWSMKRIKSDLRSIIFIMGFFNNFLNKKQNSYLKNFILSKFLKIFDTFVFLGKKEYEYAKSNFPHASHKFIYIPFSIDVEFWKNENNDLSSRQNILFIGNDQNRDFELLRKIANSLPGKNFLFVTNSEFLNLPSNVRMLKGSWRTELISDSEIKNLYMSSWLSIIPLKQSLQPSGQSVALQSMSMHIPVMISLTKGFWDEDLFEDEKNIYFIKNGIEEWVSKIENLHKNNNLKLLTENAYKTVSDSFNINKNYNQFSQLVNVLLKN